MQNVIDILGEQEAGEAGMTYTEYLADLQRQVKLIESRKPKAKAMSATAGR